MTLVLAAQIGIEPMTLRLTGDRSTSELLCIRWAMHGIATTDILAIRRGDAWRRTFGLAGGRSHECVLQKMEEAEGLEPPTLIGHLFSRQHPHPVGLLPYVAARALARIAGGSCGLCSQLLRQIPQAGIAPACDTTCGLQDKPGRSANEATRTRWDPKAPDAPAVWSR